MDVELAGNGFTAAGAKLLSVGVAVSPTIAAIRVNNNDLREEGGQVRESEDGGGGMHYSHVMRGGWVLHGNGLLHLSPISPPCLEAMNCIVRVD